MCSFVCEQVQYREQNKRIKMHKRNPELSTKRLANTHITQNDTPRLYKTQHTNL
jgi:hypothetical protein